MANLNAGIQPQAGGPNFVDETVRVVRWGYPNTRGCRDRGIVNREVARN